MENERLKIEEVLQLKGSYIGPTVGVSMLPMLKNRRDTIVVKPKTERLKRLDVALYSVHIHILLFRQRVVKYL